MRLTPEQFDQVAERALARIAPRYRKRMRNVVIVIEAEPPRPGLLGLYEGRPLPARSVAEPFQFPDRITIYQGPHERASRTMDDLETMVTETIWHEIGHHFGLDEAQVQSAERRRIRQSRRAGK